MDLKIKGTIKTIGEVQEGVSKQQKPWKKLTFVISNNDGYEGKEQIFAFDVFGEERVDNFIQYNPCGSEVEVSFNIQTNEWQGKYYTSLQSWRVEKGTEGTNEVPTAGTTTQPVHGEEPDDLPF